MEDSCVEGKDWRYTKTAHSRYDHHFGADLVQVLIKAAFTIVPHGAVGRGHREIRTALECDGFCWEILLRDDWKTYRSSKQTSSATLGSWKTCTNIFSRAGLVWTTLQS